MDVWSPDRQVDPIGKSKKRIERQERGYKQATGGFRQWSREISVFPLDKTYHGRPRVSNFIMPLILRLQYLHNGTLIQTQYMFVQPQESALLLCRDGQY